MVPDPLMEKMQFLRIQLLFQRRLAGKNDLHLFRSRKFFSEKLMDLPQDLEAKILGFVQEEDKGLCRKEELRYGTGEVFGDR